MVTNLFSLLALIAFVSYHVLVVYLFLVFRFRDLRKVGASPWYVARRVLMGKSIFGE